MQRKWTEDEDDIVAMMLRNLSTKHEIAAAVNRSVGSIEARIDWLGGKSNRKSRHGSWPPTHDPWDVPVKFENVTIKPSKRQTLPRRITLDVFSNIGSAAALCVEN